MKYIWAVIGGYGIKLLGQYLTVIHLDMSLFDGGLFDGGLFTGFVVVRYIDWVLSRPSEKSEKSDPSDQSHPSTNGE